MLLEIEKNGEEVIAQIYDKIFKKIITLSDKSVLNLINALFGTEYSEDCKVSYDWTESVDGSLQRRLADTILAVDEGGDDGDVHRYHMEAQIDKDEEIVFRVFDYGYKNAIMNKTAENDAGGYTLRFSEPKIIYIYSAHPVPDEYTLTLDFETQGKFEYKVGTVKLNEISVEELNERKMIILIPFKLLELRETIKKSRTRENIMALQSLIFDGIIGSIRKNVRLENITVADGRMLINMTKKLYDHIYVQYKELEEVTDMTDESIMLEIEMVERKYEERERKYEEQLREKNREIQRLTFLLENSK